MLDELIDMVDAMLANPTIKDGLWYALPAEDLYAQTMRGGVRALVWRRDQGRCHVCGRVISMDRYECGHIIDRYHGGIDHPSNLVVMCCSCNQHKPLHTTRQEYLDWLAAGAWMAEFRAHLHKQGIALPE